MKKRASLHNLGCKVNAYELDVMEGLLEEAGYEIVPFSEPADIVIINTCTVTNIADRKSRQMLHRARRLNPGALIVAVGCYVQAGQERALQDEGIDLCIGNNRKGEIVRLLADYLEGEGGKLNGLIDLSSSCSYEDMQLKKISDHTRAYIKIQDGCNQFCTYCIIPFARGRVRSRRPEEILREVETLSAQGLKEFVVTGIHISSYGYDLIHPEAKPLANRFAEEELLSLLRAMDALPGVERIRLSSLEPRIISEDFVREIAGLKSICPHFHLSLQSGSNSVLKRMNRQYDAEDYAARVELLRKHFDDPAITTDIIVGFPGETEEEFCETLAFAERIGFFEMHIFPYSRRKGTPAATMAGQLTEAEKAARSDRLEAIGNAGSDAFRKSWLGRQAEVLYEEEKVLGGKRYLTGHTREYIRVVTEKTDAGAGDIRTVTLAEGPEDGFCCGIE